MAAITEYFFIFFFSNKLFSSLYSFINKRKPAIGIIGVLNLRGDKSIGSNPWSRNNLYIGLLI